MAKEVTALSLEGTFLRGVKLVESGGGFARQTSGAWSLKEETGDKQVSGDVESGPGTPAGDQDLPEEAGEDMSAADRMALAFHEAAQTFKTREFILSVPLSRLLVKVVRTPVDEHDDLLEKAQAELEAISPFPDEPLVVGVETVAETDKEIVSAVAALPSEAAADISDALAAAKVCVTRTDITAFGRLRAFWPQICAKEGASRRLVLMNIDDGWDILVLDDGAPVFLRGLGSAVRTPEELARDVTLSLLQGEHAGGVRTIDDVVVFSSAPLDKAFLERLAAFGPVRVADASMDEYESVEGVAQRSVEGATFDATPEEWAMALRESRFKKKLTIGISAAMAIWLLAMGTFFGVPFAYGQLAARQVAQSKRHQSAYRAVKSIETKLKMVQGYNDREHGALMLLKHISDALPDGARLREFRYTRGDSVFVQGDVDQDTIVYDYKNALFALRNDDEEGSKMFPGGVELSGLRQNKFRLDAVLKAPDDDEPAARTQTRRRTQ